MKRIILAVTLLTLAFSFSTAQKTAPIKKVEVTAATIASQPAGKPYRIDLTRKGTIYSVAAGIDYSLVMVNTSRGEMPLSDVVRTRLGTGTGGKLILGTLSDLRTQKFLPPPFGGASEPPGGGTAQADQPPYACTRGICACKGFSGCLLLKLDEKCSGELVYFEVSKIYVCVAKK